MKKFYVVTAVVLFAAVSMTLWAQAEPPDGAKLFGEKCAMCHGAKGEGNKDTGMPTVVGTKMTAENIATFLLKGEEGKSVHANPMGQLNEEQAKAVAAFIKELK